MVSRAIFPPQVRTMNESNVSSKIIKDLKRSLPGAIIWKLNDLSTAGIPDIAINYRLKTTYVEVKYIRAEESRSKFLKHFDKQQLASNVLLSRHASVFYLVAYEMDFGTRAFLFDPGYLKRYLDADQNDDFGRTFVGTKFGKVWNHNMFGSLENVIEFITNIIRGPKNV